MRVMQASFVKLAWRPGTRRTLLVMAGFLVLFYLMIGASAGRFLPDPGTRGQIESMLVYPAAAVTLSGLLLVFGGLAAAAFGGVVAGSEWGWNTYRSALTRGEPRARYLISLIVAIVLLALVTWVVLYFLGLLLITAAAAVNGLRAGDAWDPTTLPQHLVAVATGWWAVAMEIAIAFAASFISRSTVVGIAAVAGLYFLEMTAGALLPLDLLQFAPTTAASLLVGRAVQSGLDAAALVPLAVVTVYLLAAVTVVGLVARRAEVA